MRLAFPAIVLLAAAVPAAAAPTPGQASFIRALDRMMVDLAPQSAHAAATIRRVYRDHLDLLMLDAYADLEGALGNGGLVPVPVDPLRFNLAPRLEGPHPIGEKDLVNQESYVAARPAMMGVLVEIASRVSSGPVEITSLVRHNHYQEALSSTNANAKTSVPMHTLGLAADIGLVNTPLRTVHEIRDVLLQMQRDGDILFIGERRQLVFHVVPHPSRLGHFSDLYARTVGLPPTSQSAHVFASLPASEPAVRKTALAIGGDTPSVTAEVVSLLPADVSLDPLWFDSMTETAEPLSAGVPVMPRAAERTRSSAPPDASRTVLLLGGMLVLMWRFTARPRHCGLFDASQRGDARFRRHR